MNDRTVVQEEIELCEYWHLVARSWRIWVSIGVIAGLSAAFWSYCIQATEYAATTSIVTAGQLSATSGQATSIVQALPIELRAAPPEEASLCQYILATEATRRRVVGDCSLQEHLHASSQHRAVQQLGNRTQMNIERPNIVRLKVSLPGPSRLRGLFAQARIEQTAQLSVRVVNAYLAALNAQLQELHLTAAKRRRIFLEEQKEQIRAELERAEERLQKWQARHKVIETDTAGTLATQGLVGLETQQEKARVELRAAKQREANLAQQLQQQPQMEPASVVRHANPLIDEIRGKIVDLQARLAVATEVEGKSKQHPEVRALQQQVEAATRALAEEQQQAMLKASVTEVANPTAKKVTEELALQKANRAALEAKIEGLQKAIQRAEQEMTQLSGEALEYNRLLREAQIKQTLFKTLTAQYEQALIEEQATKPVFYVVDEAVPPEGPEGPSPLVQMGLAGVIGILLGWIWIIASTQLRPDEGNSSAAPG